MIAIRLIRNTLLTALLSVCSTAAMSQDSQGTGDNANLTLFDAVETTQERPTSPNRSARESRVTSAEPEFTLIGTSRIGNAHSVMVRHKSGEILRVKANGNGNTAIADFDGYSLVNVASGAVSISFPANNPCREFTDQGVRCSGAGNIAELVLATGEPLPASVSLASPASAPASGEIVESTDTEPANPFEALRNAGTAPAGQDEDNAGRRFTPRRISPDDVPEGMRIIATPFGDRLVEQ